MNDTRSTILQFPIREQLHEQLFALNFYAFEQLVKEMLRLSGYSSVHLSGRIHKRGRVRAVRCAAPSDTALFGTTLCGNASGGHELRAYSRTDLASALTLVQVKQYKRVVSRRFVDELRGTMLRCGAKQGLLITTSTFSKVAHQAAQASDAAPVRLIDGGTLLGLMIERGIGIYQRDDGIFAMDTELFDNLQKRYTSTDRGRVGRGALPSKPGKARPSSANEHEIQNLHLQNKTSDKQPSDDKSHTFNKTHQSGGGMTWRTHLFFGINSLWLLQAVPAVADIAFDSEHLPLLIGAAAFGSLLPDLDASESKIKHLAVGGIKPFLLPSQAIHRYLGHRGFSHSLAALLLVSLLVLPLAFWWGLLPPLALLLGYGSHLAADACTRSGIPLLYPRKMRYHLLPRSLRFTTGSMAEDALFVCLALLALLLLLNSLNSYRTDDALLGFGFLSVVELLHNRGLLRHHALVYSRN